MHVVQLNLYIYYSLLWRRGTMVEEVDKLPPASRYEFSSTSTFFVVAALMRSQPTEACLNSAK
jgi:hypothetical protein